MYVYIYIYIYIPMYMYVGDAPHLRPAAVGGHARTPARVRRALPLRQEEDRVPRRGRLPQLPRVPVAASYTIVILTIMQ